MKLATFLQKHRRTPGLKATLVSAMLLTVAATAVIIYLPWDWMSKRNIETIVDQTNQEIAVGTSKEVERLFSNAESAQQFLNSSLSQNLLNLADPKDREYFLLNVLSANPVFTWVQYGDANGDFFGAQRTSNGEIRFHLRDWDPATETTTVTINTYVAKDDILQPVDQQVSKMDPPFYAPQRPWYQSAVKSSNSRAWTVYVYRSTNTPGMDATKAVKKNGQTIGVIGVGIELKQLSEYLERLQGDRPGETFIINSKQELIASTDLKEIIPTQTPDGQDAHLEKFENVQNPLLQYASQKIQQQELATDNLKTWQRLVYTDPATGEHYYVSLTPLDQLDWTVGTVIPESVYTAEINRNKRILLAVVVVFTGGIATAAIVLADRLIARPVLGIANAATDIESGEFELKQLGEIAHRTDEIGQLARIFRKMAQEVYQREQRLRRQVRELRVEIDEAKRNQQVKEIVETDFFQDLANKAKALRARSQE